MFGTISKINVDTIDMFVYSQFPVCHTAKFKGVE